MNLVSRFVCSLADKPGFLSAKPEDIRLKLASSIAGRNYAAKPLFNLAMESAATASSISGREPLPCEGCRK